MGAVILPFALGAILTTAIWLAWVRARDTRLARLLGEHPTVLLMRSRRYPAKENENVRSGAAPYSARRG